MATLTLTRRPHLIVLGNEKGGSGKSTLAMHVIVALLRDGYQVGAIDLDGRQATLTNALAARTTFAEARKLTLPVPRAAAVLRSEQDSRAAAAAEEGDRFAAALTDLNGDCDVLVIDCPGADTHLSRLAHASADTLITPINDSFVDFSMLAKVEPENHAVVHPAIYSEMVWAARKQRFARDRGHIDWIVTRNRLGANEARNKRDVGATLEALARRIGFRTVKGFGERVIFRELYLQGLTLMDLREADLGIALGASHVAARMEVRVLVGALRLPPARARGAEAMGANVPSSLAVSS